MKTKKKELGIKLPFKGLRFIGMTLLVTSIGIAIAVAVSAQIETTTPKPEPEGKKTEHPNPLRTAPKLDAKTGQVRPLTPQEAKEMAAELKLLLNRSEEGLTEVKDEDGTVSIDLKGRFQNVSIAKKKADGSIEHTCVDHAEGAASFLGIDPEHLKTETNLTNKSNKKK